MKPYFELVTSYGKVIERQAGCLLSTRKGARLARSLSIQTHPARRTIQSIRWRYEGCRPLRGTGKLEPGALKGADKRRELW